MIVRKAWRLSLILTQHNLFLLQAKNSLMEQQPSLIEPLQKMQNIQKFHLAFMMQKSIGFFFSFIYLFTFVLFFFPVFFCKFSYMMIKNNAYTYDSRASVLCSGVKERCQQFQKLKSSENIDFVAIYCRVLLSADCVSALFMIFV